MRRIYKAYGIKITLWPHRLKQMRGAYLIDENGPCVMIDGTLPPEQRIFTMAHELKHHLTDHVAASSSQPANEKEPMEIGAEIFAAELIFPEQDFAQKLEGLQVSRGTCNAGHLVRLKRETGTTLSYAGLAKRAEFLGFATKGAFAGVKWKKLEEEMYGEPEYKRFVRQNKG
jgi:Zn-dependent peptidase ImmA (M78 family)